MSGSSVNLPRYVSLLKNLRGVAFFDPDAPFPLEEVKWLKKRYKYRNIGIPQSLMAAIKPEMRNLLRGRPFEVLDSPLPEIEELIRRVSEARPEFPRYVIESLTLTSCYVNALIILGRESLPILDPFIAWALRSTAELDEVEVKRNLRIIGYAITDFHNENSEEAYGMLRSTAERIRRGEDPAEVRGEIEEFTEERGRLARDDGEKRFWRLRQAGGGEERIVIAYLDLASLILRALLRDDASSLVNLVVGSTQNLSMALSLIPAFVLEA
ncbi:MAG: hypothetical protein AYL33_000300 [Candidatus Bathyarchaeota archaeon B63]|nr:MAG: hypothetical protein AYL33_000300 [Candidatus Bathyarchaeota archaeon B63]